MSEECGNLCSHIESKSCRDLGIFRFSFMYFKMECLLYESDNVQRYNQRYYQIYQLQSYCIYP